MFEPAFPYSIASSIARSAIAGRYRRRSLDSLVEAAGLHPVINRYVNSLGFFGWWLLLNSCVKLLTHGHSCGFLTGRWYRCCGGSRAVVSAVRTADISGCERARFGIDPPEFGLLRL